MAAPSSRVPPAAAATRPLSVSDAAAAYAEPLPSFRDVPAGDRQALFARKLHLCCFTFDFNDANKSLREKDVKRQTLMELVEYVNTGTGKFTEALCEDITAMLAANLFRALPPCGHETTGVVAGEAFDVEEEEPALEPAWPHLQARGASLFWPSLCSLRLTASADCLRVPAALHRVQRHRRQGGQEARGRRLRAAPAGAVRE